MSQTTVIVDANVLVDYYSVGLLDLLALYSSEISQIQIPDVILDEVDGLTEKLASVYKFVIIEVNTAIIQRAAQMKGGTSAQDNTCFLLAEIAHSICITSDKCLYNLCKNNGVRVQRNLYPILELFRMAFLTKKEALEAGSKICQANLYLGSSVLTAFEKKLESVSNK